MSGLPDEDPGGPPGADDGPPPGTTLLRVDWPGGETDSWALEDWRVDGQGVLTAVSTEGETIVLAPSMPWGIKEPPEDGAEILG